ncbi:substrate-binding periplasmic protein [Paucibacter soli]|uniref:substrate-binding periplasmic protein n=1 Tax=Paucibacter soli TaxID=3133433 RepID=UPI00309B67F3
MAWPPTLRSKLLRLISLVAILLAGPAAAAEPKALRIAVIPAWGAPYAIFKDGALVAGIDFDLAQAIGEALHLPVQHVLLPRPRVDAAAAAGEIDLRCHLSPEFTRTPEQYLWSGPLLELENVLVGHQTAEPLSSLEQLPRGQTLGTVLGFVYPGVDERVADGRLRREDTIAVERSLQKLSLNRVPYAIAEQREVSWYQRANPGHNIAFWRLPLFKAEFRCAVPKGGRVDGSAEHMLAAIERLRSSGQIERILARYLVSQPVVVSSARSPLARLSRQEVSELYLGQARTLPDGSAPQLLASAGALRDEFYARVLERDVAQVKAAWSRLLFSGKGHAPREFADPAQLRAALLANPGAIAFLDASQVDASMKVLYAP